MTDPIRVAAQALLAAWDTHRSIGDLADRMWDLRTAMATPQPAADERVAEHMRLLEAVMRLQPSLYSANQEPEYTGRYAKLAAEERKALDAVESSARALLAAGREDAETIKPERVRHVVSGRLYDLIGDATVQSDSPLTDMTQVRLYLGDDGKYWVRPIRELSARFVAAEPGPIPDMQKGTP